MSKQPQRPLLSIIIVSWNVRDLLLATLASIQANQGDLSIEVIVVDSASQDDTVEAIAHAHPDVIVLPQPENVGFPQGNNIGISAAQGDLIFLLNPDTEIVGSALQTMISYLQADPTIGMIGPELLNSDGSHQSSRRRFPTLLTALFESTWLEPLAPIHLLRRYYVQDSPDSAIVDVDWVSGAAMLTRRTVIEQVGVLDPHYFMYSEELDWCKRIKAVGWRIVYLPSAQILHHVGKSSEQAVTARHINFNQAKLRYFRKYHGRIATTLLRSALLLNFAGQYLLEAGKAAVGHKRPLRLQRMASYKAVLRSGLRPAGYGAEERA